MFSQHKLTSLVGIKHGDRVINFKLKQTKEIEFVLPVIWDDKFKVVEPGTKRLLELPKMFLDLIFNPDSEYYTVERREVINIEQQKDYAYGVLFRYLRRGMITQEELNARGVKIDVEFSAQIRAGREYLTSAEMQDIFKSVGLKAELITVGLPNKESK